MVGCTIPFCNNSTEKGYTMKILPTDKERREKWINSINTKYKWTPSKNSCVCEVHFQPEMWEQRMDNKRKLKRNAIPTIFKYYVKKQIPVMNQAPDTIEEKEKQQSAYKEEYIIANEKQMDVNEIKMHLRVMLLRKNNRILRSRIQSLERNLKNNKYKQVLKEVFNEDQIKMLYTPRRRTKYWSNETIERALKLRFTCGTAGYEELLQQKIPLPSLRTLQRRLDTLKFESGISNDMFEFLQLKVSRFQNVTDKECGLVLDEMSITPKHVYDSSTKALLGTIMLPGEEGIATHASTFMLTGTASRWKHVIIHKAEEIGLHLNYATSNMGPGNGKIWKCCGINVGRYSDVRTYIPHPSNSNRVLYFIADVPHLLKNIKESLQIHFSFCQNNSLLSTNYHRIELKMHISMI